MSLVSWKGGHYNLAYSELFLYFTFLMMPPVTCDLDALVVVVVILVADKIKSSGC